MAIIKSRQFLVKTLVLIGFWIIFAGLNILAFFSEPQLAGKYSWSQILFRFNLRWLMWIVLTPLVLWLSEAFPLEQKKWKRSVLIHSFSSLLVSSIYAELTALLIVRMEAAPSSAPLLMIVSFFQPTQIFFYWGLVGISHAIKYYGLLRDRELHSLQLEKELSEAKLHSLRSQLHPHFLFNTMHTIANLIRDKSYPAAIETISGFSELLRLSLANPDTPFVSLKDEIDYLQLYLNIESIRFKDRLSAVFEIPPDVLSCQVPFLLLQPFIENSVKHGLSKHEDSLLIRVSASRNKQGLVITVEDNGPGLPEGWSLERSSGVGLQNIHRRLAAIYGGNFTLELRNRSHSGVTATIEMPCSKKEE